MQEIVVLLLLGLVIAAAALVVVLLRQRVAGEIMALRDAKAALEGQLAVERMRASRVPELERTLAQSAGLAENLRAARTAAERDCAVATAALSRAEAGERDATARLGALRAECLDLQTRCATLEETLRKERVHAAEKLQLLQEAREGMTREFRLLADELMARHGESFSKQNREQIAGLLDPMRDKLTEFQQGLQAAHTETAKERAALGEQIRGLSEASVRMSLEATNLTRALKGKSQTQGAWGEMILASILERSGLRDGVEYTAQASGDTEEGQRLRPDVIVSLPGEQRIVIDAKVSLVAFEAHVNAAGDGERAESLARHLASMRAHIRTLAGKDYQAVAGSRLSYVVMFVPIEGALAAALQGDPELTAFALESNVTIATPTTLMIALRTVRSVWQAERRNQNAEAIAERAGRLYDKFVGFVGDLEGVGKSLRQAEDSYGAAMSKLSSGRGNLLRQVEQLKGLGARTTKALPPALLGDEGVDGQAVIEAVEVR
jgi:DNA recombination protein RmuC